MPLSFVIYFSDIGQYLHTVKTVLEIKNPFHRGSTRIVYVSRSEDTNADANTYFDADRHFLDLFGTCLYMVHFGLRTFFSAIVKKYLDRFTIKGTQH